MFFLLFFFSTEPLAAVGYNLKHFYLVFFSQMRESNSAFSLLPFAVLCERPNVMDF